MKVSDRFLEYVSYDTQSDKASSTAPSTKKQFALAQHLCDELSGLGLSPLLDEHCYVYCTIPASKGYEKCSTLALVAHMDTAQDMTGADIKPRIVHYTGGDIVLNEELNIVTRADMFPELADNIGEDLIVTDGTTLLGADDKAGIAEIMTYTELAVKDENIIHPEIQIIFTPDEEIGRGVDHIDMMKVKAEYGYTLDGGEIGQFQYETFNASSALIRINGITAHTGYAKGRIRNSLLLAMEFQSLLPQYETPYCTTEREGFYHLNEMKGTVELTTIEYSLRDHDADKLKAREELIAEACAYMNRKYGSDTVEFEIKELYRNMKEKVMEHSRLIENALRAMSELDIKPEIQVVRGGTDGARLSFMGLPCPNLCTGCHNGHSRHEYISIQSMEKTVEIIKRLASLFAS